MLEQPNPQKYNNKIHKHIYSRFNTYLMPIQYMPIFCWQQNPHITLYTIWLKHKNLSLQRENFFLHLFLSNKSSCALATSQTDCNASYLDWRCYLKRTSPELHMSHQKAAISTKTIRQLYYVLFVLNISSNSVTVL